MAFFMITLPKKPSKKEIRNQDSFYEEDTELSRKKHNLAARLADEFQITLIQAKQAVNHVFLNPYSCPGTTYSEKAQKEIERRVGLNFYNNTT